MIKRQEAIIMLDAIDEYAPTCVDWNNKELWIRAIMKGLDQIEGMKADSPAAGTAGEQCN